MSFPWTAALPVTLPAIPPEARPAVRRGLPATRSDADLVGQVRAGDAGAYEAIFRRYQQPLLSYCRHMLGGRDEAEDALQQTFIRAHRALVSGPAPRELRPWLYAIARNCCRTDLAARRPSAALDGQEAGLDGLADAVARREDLRALVADLGRLPEDQRSALLLAELDDLSHADIAAIIGCPVSKVKALVYQARSSLLADREARDASCREIREELAVARGGMLRRGPLRRHLRLCAGCRDFQQAVALQRSSLAIVLPVAASAGLGAKVLSQVAAAHPASAVAAGALAAPAAVTGLGGAGAGATATAVPLAGAGTAGSSGAAAGAGAAVTTGVAASTAAGASATAGAAATTGSIVGGGILAKLAVGGVMVSLATAGALAVHRHHHPAPRLAHASLRLVAHRGHAAGRSRARRQRGAPAAVVPVKHRVRVATAPQRHRRISRLAKPRAGGLAPRRLALRRSRPRSAGAGPAALRRRTAGIAARRRAGAAATTTPVPIRRVRPAGRRPRPPGVAGVKRTRPPRNGPAPRPAAALRPARRAAGAVAGPRIARRRV